MSKELKKRAIMNEWGSVITPFRAKHLGDIIQEIEQVSQNPVNRQVGNVIGDLKNLHEFDLINDLLAAISDYNKYVVEPFNRAVDFTHEV